MTHDRRLRVLQVARDSGYGGIGGAEMLVHEFARRLDRDRFVPYLCVTRRPTPDRAELVSAERRALEREGVRVLHLDRPSSASLRPWARLGRLLIAERIDIVHAHMPRANAPATVLARGARVPVVIAHEHGSVRYDDRLRRLLNQRVVGPLADRVFAVSEWDRHNLLERQGMDPTRVEVFANGIPPLPSPVPDVRAALAPMDRPLIGALGRLDPVKGYDDLISAMLLLRRDGIRVACVIAGIGPDEARLRSQISAAGLDGDVRLLGLREDVPSLLSAFDIAVMSSRSEGAPLALMEYMAAGLPIVATRVGGIPELIQDGATGLLCAPDSPQELADALRRVLTEPRLAGRLGVAAQDRQKREMDLDVVVRRLERRYLALYSASSRKRR